jgi:hypothetical protein
LCQNVTACNNLVTYSMEQGPSWEANRSAASQEIPQFYGTRGFITTITSACHLSLSWASSIQPVRRADNLATFMCQ